MQTDRHCMSDRIRDALSEQIFDGTLKPGDRLIELDLAQQFDTSQTPVREALRELESLGLVESQPYRGTHVREVSPREMVEAYTVRGVLEQLAAELGAAKLLENIQPLRDSVDALTAAARQGQSQLYAAHNVAFHLHIMESAENQVLLKTWRSLAFETRLRLSVSRSSLEDITDRIDIHEEILNAFLQKDGALAGRLLREHSESIGQMWRLRAEKEEAESKSPQPLRKKRTQKILD